eukprot:jgi/Bigna1/140063/aug1.54_g14771
MMDNSFWSLLGLSDCNRDAPTGTECRVDEHANIAETNSFTLLAGFVLFFVFALCVVGFGCFCGRSKRPRASSEKADHSNPSTRKSGNIDAVKKPVVKKPVVKKPVVKMPAPTKSKKEELKRLRDQCEKLTVDVRKQMESDINDGFAGDEKEARRKVNEMPQIATRVWTAKAMRGAVQPKSKVLKDKFQQKVNQGHFTQKDLDNSLNDIHQGKNVDVSTKKWMTDCSELWQEWQEHKQLEMECTELDGFVVPGWMHEHALCTCKAFQIEDEHTKAQERQKKKIKELKQKSSEMKGWTKLPDVNTERQHLGVAVGDGKLFAVGGCGGDFLKSGEHLDLKNVDAGWTKIPDMNAERLGLGVAVGDGKLFAVGGRIDWNALRNGEHLDLKNVDAGWKKLPDVNMKRWALGVAVGDGKLFAVGGWDEDGNHLKSGEHLDLKKMDAGWKKLPDVNTKRSHLGVAVGGGKLFAVGGSGKSGEHLDLKNVGAGWKKIPDMNTKRDDLGVAVADGKLFAVGGCGLKSGEHLDLKNVGAGWKKIPDMNTKRSWLGVAVGDGKLFAVGGWDGNDVLKNGEHLRIAMWTASAHASGPVWRNHGHSWPSATSLIGQMWTSISLSLSLRQNSGFSSAFGSSIARTISPSSWSTSWISSAVLLSLA